MQWGAVSKVHTAHCTLHTAHCTTLHHTLHSAVPHAMSVVGRIGSPFPPVANGLKWRRALQSGVRSAEQSVEWSAVQSKVGSGVRCSAARSAVQSSELQSALADDSAVAHCRAIYGAVEEFSMV